MRTFGAIFLLATLAAVTAGTAERPEIIFKVFQFPAEMIPRIDGNADD